VEVRLDIPRGDDLARGVDGSGNGSDGALSPTDVRYAPLRNCDVALVQLAGVDVGYRAAAYEKVSRPVAAPSR
jgi:hypothetical protein